MKFTIQLLTLLRFPLALICWWSFQQPRNLILSTCFFILALLTDLFDGYLARRYQLTSNCGARLDIIADFWFVSWTSFALYQLGFYPTWFLFVLVSKFIEFCWTSHQMTTTTQPLIFDTLGRWNAISWMVLPIIILWSAAIWPNLQDHNLFSLILLVSSGLAGISSIQRLLNLMHSHK